MTENVNGTVMSCFVYFIRPQTHRHLQFSSFNSLSASCHLIVYVLHSFNATKQIFLILHAVNHSLILYEM